MGGRIGVEEGGEDRGGGSIDCGVYGSGRGW